MEVIAPSNAGRRPVLCWTPPFDVEVIAIPTAAGAPSDTTEGSG
jgi:hypothetical protein